MPRSRSSPINLFSDPVLPTGVYFNLPLPPEKVCCEANDLEVSAALFPSQDNSFLYPNVF